MSVSDSTSSYKAVIYADPPSTKTEVVDLDIPEPDVGQVLVRLHYSGVCHTDYSFCTNGFVGAPPTMKGQIGGHEGIGEVVKLGPGVVLPAVGTRVGIKYAADACLNCEPCLLGGETSCTQVKISGFYTPGTFQQYCLTSAKYATVIPDGLPSDAAAPLMCAGITVYSALTRGGVKPGDWVLVTGAGGGLGHLGVQYARALGARVLAVDHGSKEDLCRSLGADEFVDFSQFPANEPPGESQMAARIRELTAGGVKIALMCSSNSGTYEQAVYWLRFRGTIVCVGVPDNAAVMAGSPMMFLEKELRMIGVKTANRQEAVETLALAAKGAIKTHFEVRPMGELTQIFEEMEKGMLRGRVVLDLR
ncbi:alcohol dehydrogenase [Microdochium trichocladiopsis]|uniref:Alcohol dehydrogenase n=1 Tax=Microdochium trichocladiopsis TaxID=1682393 RepID=A0A9P8YKH8_9PEZI|nr:alcohol dehydrogenase [Microdochium trichocladiopsis]KAH7041146.1 alcohol dehydrogenase [Microdochium trichocladiopsis]